MTERKSTEIKIRVTPSFKARVQSAADAAGVSLTEWLEDASEEKMLALLTPAIAREGWKFREMKDGDEALDAREFIERWTPESHPATTTQSGFQDFLLKGPSVVDPPERRTEPCSHSKPPYAFCAECDR